MSWTRAVEFLLIPPSAFFFLCLAGLALVCFRRWRRPGLVIATGPAALLYLSSTLLVGDSILSTFDRYPAINAADLASVQAIVILGAGTRDDPAGEKSVAPRGHERLAAGAEIHRRSGKPILVTGFSGALMGRELEESFAVPVRWVEGESLNTHENAVRTAPILRADGITRVALVTHYWHMPRAVEVFRFTGLDVVPAPMGFEDGSVSLWRRLVPSRAGYDNSEAGLHEAFGRIWYRWHYGY